MSAHQRTDFDHARDELMSHIHRCGVLKASAEHQEQWFQETMEYMAERYTSLKAEELSELQQIGKRFCQPVIPHGRADSVISDRADSEQGELAGAA